MNNDRIIRQEESYRVPINPQQKISPRISPNELYEIRQMILDELVIETEILGLYSHQRDIS